MEREKEMVTRKREILSTPASLLLHFSLLLMPLHSPLSLVPMLVESYTCSFLFSGDRALPASLLCLEKLVGINMKQTANDNRKAAKVVNIEH